MHKTRRAYHLNVVGDFYVEDGCCTVCGVPEVTAPDLFGPDGPWGEHTDHCFVRRQPETRAEVGRMLETIRCAELRCIRYRGSDSAIIAALRASGELEQWDREP